MTVMPCPYGCGGYFVNNEDEYCPSCRRSRLNLDLTFSQPEGSCWEWWGPPDHRMKCRLPKGHSGDHWDHETREGVSLIITDSGKLVGSERAGEAP